MFQEEGADAADHFEVAGEFLVRFFAELADAEAEVFVFLGEDLFFFADEFVLAGFEFEFVAEVAAVATEFAFGFEVAPEGEEEEEEAEAEPPDEGLREEFEDGVHERVGKGEGALGTGV